LASNIYGQRRGLGTTYDVYIRNRLSFAESQQRRVAESHEACRPTWASGRLCRNSSQTNTEFLSALHLFLKQNFRARQPPHPWADLGRLEVPRNLPSHLTCTISRALFAPILKRCSWLSTARQDPRSYGRQSFKFAPMFFRGWPLNYLRSLCPVPAAAARETTASSRMEVFKQAASMASRFVYSHSSSKFLLPRDI
jgi:hypothetical protein